MADFAKLHADIAELSGKVDTLIAAGSAKDAQIADLEAKLAAVVDEQPAVDAADAEVAAIGAKIP